MKISIKSLSNFIISGIKLKLIKGIENGIIKIYEIIGGHCISMDSIRLKDKSGNDIFVGDILYNPSTNAYHTVFEVPGGYAIESNPKSFGLWDHFNGMNGSIPVYESTGDPQTSSYIQGGCKVIGNIYENRDLYGSLMDKYKKGFINPENLKSEKES